MLRTRAPSLSLPGADNFDAQLQRLQAERAATERAYLTQLATYDAALQRLLLAQQQQRQPPQRRKPSYIARLPPEILSEIACHVSPVLPLLLVSKLWKNTLEATPALWASIALPAQPTAASLRALRRHLELAKAAPLFVRVQAALCAPQHLQSYWAGMALLRGSLARVRALEISVKDRSQLADVLAHLAAPAPGLRALVLHGPHGEQLHPAHVPPDVLVGAPLRRIVLDHACVPAAQLVRAGLPLHELDVTAVFHDAALEGKAFAIAVDRVALTLERLRVCGLQWRANPAPRLSLLLGLPAIEAPVLRELSLDNAPLQELVTRLSAPALRTVSLRAVVGPLDVSFLGIAAAALEELALVDVSLQLPASTLPLRLPRLATLTLKVDDSARLLDALALPALHTADIRQPDGAVEDAGSFLAAVDAFLLRAARTLQALTLRAQRPSAKDAPCSLTAPCPSLERLHLLDMGAVTFASVLGGVHDLKLTGGCPDAVELVRALPNVRHLAMHAVDAGAVDACVSAVSAGAWSELEDVEFEHCPMMDGEALVAAVAAGRRGRLRDVQLWSCGGVSGAQRDDIRKLMR